jgi:hypothetical protein
MIQKERQQKLNEHKKVLNIIKQNNFFANRNNQQKIYKQVKGMAKEIDDLYIRLDKHENCTCKKDKLNNFDGEGDTSLLNKKTLVIGGVVAIAILLFTPFGQKLLN